MSLSIFAMMVMEKGAKAEGSRTVGRSTCQFHLYFNVQEVQSVSVFFYFIVFLTLLRL